MSTTEEIALRKLVLYTLMSLDGAVDYPAHYFTPGHPSGMSVEPEFDAEMERNEAAVIESQDAVLLGRNMYDEWAAYWPAVHHHPFADFINRVPKYVVTSKPLATPWHNSEAVHAPVENVIRRLKAQRGGDIGVHGSIQLAQALLALGVVDELRLVVGPSFGFTGRRLFETTNAIRRLELLSAVPTPSGSLLLAYRIPSHAPPARQSD